MERRNKKGTHVGIILSFVLFITFLMFMMVVLKPSSEREAEKRYNIDLLKNSLLNKIEKEVYTVSISNSLARTDEDCISVSDEYSSSDFGTVNHLGENIGAVRSGDNIIAFWTGEPLIKISYSKGFQHLNNSEVSYCITGEIENIKQSNEIFEESIKEIISNYSSDYEQVRTLLGIPQNEEFGIRFKYGNGTIIGNETRDIKSDIFVESFQVSYLDKFSNKKMGELILYAW